MKTTVLKISALILTLFALITVFMSGSVIFDLFGIRAKEGNYVLFIVVSNFISGFLYLISAYGMFFQKKWTTRLLVFITTILLLSFAGLLWHINGGGVYEQQTIKAMLFRIGITILFAGLSWRYITKETKVTNNMKRTIGTSILAVMLLGITVGFTSCDENDPLPANDLTSQVASLPRESLNTDETNSLIFMREEEKLARDVYAALYTKWNIGIFSNIGESEQAHMDAILQLINKYSLSDPVGDNSAGIFDNIQLQELYNQLVEQGSISITDAMQVGATIEDLDIYDLENALSKIDNQDIRLVYESLTKGSRNHLRSFYSNILILEETYVPQFITQDKFDAIVNSPIEKGR